MTLTAAIDISSPCVNWKRACPDLERLVRDTAHVALVEGIAAIGVTSLAQVELGVTLTDDAHQRELNRIEDVHAAGSGTGSGSTKVILVIN